MWHPIKNSPDNRTVCKIALFPRSQGLAPPPPPSRPAPMPRAQMPPLFSSRLETCRVIASKRFRWWMRLVAKAQTRLEQFWEVNLSVFSRESQGQSSWVCPMWLWVKTQEPPGEHHNRWQMDDHPPQNGAIGYAPWPCVFRGGKKQTKGIRRRKECVPSHFLDTHKMGWICPVGFALTPPQKR